MSKKLRIEFDNVKDLFQKFEKIKQYLYITNLEIAQKLGSVGVKVEAFDTYAIAIDVENLNEDGVAILKSRDGQFEQFLKGL